MDVPPIRSERLELVSLSPPLLAALVDRRRDHAEALLGATLPPGWPGPSVRPFLRLRLGQLERSPELQQWLVRAVVLRDEERGLVGHAGFHGPPGVNGPQHPRALELGYAILPAFRRRGYATETAAALVRWARTEHGIEHFVASVAPGNAASLAVIRKLGFVRTGEQWDDEDGLEHVFELRTPAVA